MTPLGIAVIGCGFQGRYHARNVVDSPDTRLVWVCDVDSARTSALSDEVGAEGTVSPDEVLRDPAVEAVVIATTTNTHHELAVAAAAHGKHILLEKPMALTVDECLEIERAALDASVKLMLGYKFRFTAASVAARQAVPNPMVLVANTMYDPLPGGGGWVNDRSLSGGRLVSALVHSIDLLRFLAGSEVRRVTAEGANVLRPDLAEPYNTVATMAFESGAIASIAHGTVAASSLLSVWSFQAAQAGLHATIHDHGRRLSLHVAGADADPPDVVDETEDAYAAGTRPLLDAFVSAVRGSGPESPGAWDGIASLQVARCIEQAMATGAPQEIPVLAR